VVTVLHDQTGPKRLEREREDLHARELAAEQVAEQMSAILATAAHDIRTPFTVAAAQVHVAQRRAKRLAAAMCPPLTTSSGTLESPTRLIDGVVESLESAHAGMDRLGRLVKVLFDVTKTQALVLEIASCDLKALVQRNVAAQQAAAGGRRIRVQVPKEEVLVEADADRLDEVLTNFVTNALKYSPADQPVTVRLEVVEQQAVVRVTDHGPGLPPEEQSRIWEMYHRVPGIAVQSGSGGASGSLGLGLHICKQLIERHPGGHIGVDSAVGAGSTFWFRLPLDS
jgi:signal transduction histidine kinase